MPILSIDKIAKYYREILSQLGKSAQSTIGNLIGARSNAIIADLSYFTNEENFLFSHEIWTIRIPKPEDGIVDELLKRSALAEELEAEDIIDEESISQEEKEIKMEGQQEQAARLKAIWSKTATGKGERETYYGCPLLCGRNNGKVTVAPLFLARVDISFRPERNEFKLIKIDDSPAINWNLLSSLCAIDDERAGLYAGLQEFLREGITLSTVKEFVTALSNLLACCQTLKFKHFNNLDDYSHARELSRQDSFFIANTPILINAKRAHLYLVQDLEAIADGKATLNGISVAGEFLKEHEVGSPKVKKVEKLFKTTFLDLCFPLVTNDEQMRAAKYAGVAKVTVVEGPPGTGKSHMITNLITHLASTGKSVLMTSQKSQALKVIRERLKKLELDSWAMAMLKGDAASKQELQNKINEINLMGHASSAESEEEIEKLQKYRSKLKEGIKNLESLFNKARNSENDYFESAFNFDKLSSYNKISPLDEIPQGKENAIASALKEFKDIYSNSVSSINKLEDAYRKHSELNNNIIFEEPVRQSYEFIIMVSDSFQKRTALEATSYWNSIWPIVCKERIALKTFQEILDWFSKYAPEFNNSLNELEKDDNKIEITSLCVSALDMDISMLEGVLNESNLNKERIQKALNTSSHRDLFQKPNSITDVHIMQNSISLLRSGAKSWWKWTFSKVLKKAKNYVSSSLSLQIQRRNACEIIDKCNYWCEHWNARFSVVAACDEAASFLNDTSCRAAIDEPLANLAKKNQKIGAYSTLLRAVKALSLKPYSIPLGQILISILSNIEQNNLSSLQKFLIDFSDFLENREVIQKLGKEIDDLNVWGNWPKNLVSICFDESVSPKDLERLKEFQLTVEKYGDYTRLNDLYNGILVTLI